MTLYVDGDQNGKVRLTSGALLGIILDTSLIDTQEQYTRNIVVVRIRPAVVKYVITVVLNLSLNGIGKLNVKLNIKQFLVAFVHKIEQNARDGKHNCEQHADNNDENLFPGFHLLSAAALAFVMMVMMVSAAGGMRAVRMAGMTASLDADVL